MTTLNSIGLDSKKAKQLAENLNTLLANFQLYYQNLRGIHWNIKGRAFFDLHVKFEELYNDANMKVDEIAELFDDIGAAASMDDDLVEPSQEDGKPTTDELIEK